MKVNEEKQIKFPYDGIQKWYQNETFKHNTDNFDSKIIFLVETNHHMHWICTKSSFYPFKVIGRKASSQYEPYINFLIKTEYMKIWGNTHLPAKNMKQNFVRLWHDNKDQQVIFTREFSTFETPSRLISFFYRQRN